MFGKQLYLLLWKNLILRKRHPIRTLIEIVWPLILLVVLVIIRKTQEIETKNECHYPARAMPSAGVYPWFKSLLCDIQNPCFSIPVASETPGQINDPVNITNGALGSLLGIASLLNQNTSIFSNTTQLTSDLQLLLSTANNALQVNNTTPLLNLLDNATLYKDYLVVNLTLPANEVETIVNSQVTFVQATTLPTLLGSRLVVCNESTLALALQIPSTGPSTVSQVSASLCNLTDAELTFLSSITLEQLGNATTLTSKYTSLGLTVLNTSAVQNPSLLPVLGRITQYSSELSSLQGPISELLALTGQSSVGTSLLTSLLSTLLGVDLSSPNVFNDICGHPENASNIFTTFSQASGQNDSINNALSAALDTSTANSNNSVDFCDNLIGIFENNSQLNFLWDSVKPLLLGKIPYTPDTPLVRTIIKEANRTFESIAFLKSLGENWQSTTGPALYRELESGNLTTTLRLTLNSTLGVQIVANATNRTEAEIRQLAAFLSNDDNPNDNVTTWKDTYRQINSLIVLVTRVLECLDLNKFVPYDSEPELVTDSLQMLRNKTLWGGVVFLSPTSSDTEMPDVVKYKIRQDSDAVTWTIFIQRFFWRPGSNSGTSRVKYYIGGFVHLQDLVENAIVTLVGRGNQPSLVYDSPGSYLQLMPYPCYTRDRFLEYLSGLLSLIMTLAWIYTVCITVKNIVYEKEQRLKEVMKMMGLSNGVHWVAWFINSFVLMFVTILFMLIILKVGSVTPFSNMFIILLWLCCFAIATIAQCFLISCFFSRANLAAACGGIIYFVLYIPYNMVVAWESRMTLTTKLIACLLSNVAFGYGATYISNYEMAGDGIQFSNWNTSPDPSDQLNFVTTLVMMLVDAVIYFILTWYIENVFPGRYGVPRPWYFFATKLYWCGASSSSGSKEPPNLSSVNFLDAKMEREPDHLPLGVAMHNLRKVYGNGKVAVDDLSMNFYEDQITSFLGHNGAGKTTTMSMLTGLFTPTSGTAYVYGNDICAQMDNIRHQLGFCPQHNVLFGDLTVKEHLQLYSGLKNSQGGKEEIVQMLDDVGLPHKKDEISRHLSGGMKRKLSVAVAFVGGSKCVILDEPTAGVDPYARRGIWDLLLAYKKSRTIILSTHHMDEADLLGDRIAIISHGKLKCCGSSLFLKSNYGVGYYLTVVKNETEPTKNAEAKVDFLKPFADDQTTKDSIHSAKVSDEGIGSVRTSELSSNASSTSLGDSKASTFSSTPMGDSDVVEKFMEPEKNGANDIAKASDVTKLVQEVIPKAKVHEQDSHEITFVLPYEAQNDGRYAKLFAALDARGSSYGLTDTSLEEIFLAVAEQNRDEGKDEKKSCCCFPRRRRVNSIHQEEGSMTDFQARRGSSRRKKRSRNSSHAPCCFANCTDSLSGMPFSSLGSGSQETLQGAENQFEDGSRGAGSYKIVGKKLVLQQFKALFIKRFHHARRNGKGFVAQVLVPAIFVALALAFALILPSYTSLPPLELQPWMYGNDFTFYSNDDPSLNLSSQVSEALLDSPGIGMRCVTNYSVLNFNNRYLACDSPDNRSWYLDDSIRGHSPELTSPVNITCACTNKETRVLLAECPIGAGGESTPLSMTETRNPMYNMTGRDVADWLVKTVDRFRQERYGGLSLGETYHTGWSQEQSAAIQSLFSSASASNFSNVGLQNFIRTENTQVWFDNNGYHSMPIWLNVLNNAALRSLLPSDGTRKTRGIAVVNHPLNFTETQVDQAAFTQSATDTIISICVIFSLSFIPASFVLFLIEEKVTKAKHLQFVSGVNQFIYWIANFLWDLVNYAVPALIVMLIFICFQTKAYVSPTNLPALVCLLFLYGFAITPMMYPAAFYFTVPSTAYVVLTCVNIFIGINTSLATFILELLDDPILKEVNVYLQRIFLIFPQYCLGRGLIDMAVNQAYADAYAAFGVDRYKNPFDFDLVGRNLMALALEGTFFFILTILIQYRFFVKPSAKNDMSVFSPKDLDDDVIAEQNRVIDGYENDVLKIRGLSKIYKMRRTGKPLLAVDRMHVGVPKGECFGLLGVNGAGKTTTFKMLTGDTTPSSGEAYICGHSILTDMRDAQQNTGYCPQFEALNSLLTGREHLEFYAKLRGVPPADIDKVAAWGIDNFGLKMYAEKCAGTYSGGNKRKLSAAIAFIGCPPVVFLDEPTAGMDPMSRRFLWGRIAEAVKGGRCIILTSHSMEECEALCSRIAIMVNGCYQCIGSPQHLKNRYGEGYTLSIKFDPSCSDIQRSEDFIARAFPTSLLKEKHSNMFLYQIPLSDAKLSYVFDTLEANRQNYNIEDYSLSQTTLDEVFVNFAKMQTDGLEEEYGLQKPKPKPLFKSQQPTLPGVTGLDNPIVLESLSESNRIHDSSVPS